jgi:hypothetical protein
MGVPSLPGSPATSILVSNNLDFPTGVEMICTHMPLLLELDKIMEETKYNINAIHQAQLQKIARYKWKDSHRLL